MATEIRPGSLAETFGRLGFSMNEKLQDSLIATWRQLPADVRSEPATLEELRQFEHSFGPIPADFRWFLSCCGGGPVGSEWVDDIEKLSDSHVKFNKELSQGGWTMTDVFVIGWDGSGNPFGISRHGGKLLVEDHNFGGVHEMAESFVTFLANALGVATEPFAAPDRGGT